jgi:hypothetical protein
MKYRGRTILCGSKCMRTGLWMIPLQPIQPSMIPLTNNLPPMALAANVAATSTAGNHARFLHQALCSPPTTSLLRALAHSTKFKTFPGLTPHLIIHHLPPSTATNKGHMRQHCQGTQFTWTNQPVVQQAQAQVDHLVPTKEICAAHNMFCYAALANLHTGMVYTDGTGAFPVHSFWNMQ